MVASPAPQPPEFSVSNMITNAAALRLGHFLRRSLVSQRHRLRSILQSPLKIPHLGHVLELNGVSNGGSHQFEWFNLSRWSHNSWATMFSSSILSFGGEGNKTNYGDQENAYLKRTPMSGGPVKERRLTNILLAVNVLVYVAQVASQGQVLMWGAKVNSLIDKGELWRLVTCAFLHANVVHLMVRLIVYLYIPLALPLSI